MVISLLTYLLISNALTLRKDKSILFSRIVMLSLILIAGLTFNNLFVSCLDKGVGIYNGLFHVTSFTQSFNIFIFIVTAIILILTSFYPRKAFVEQYSSLRKLLSLYFIYNKTVISNRMSEQFRIIEYSLIIVFVVTGAVFLMSASDLVSIFLSIELQSYGLYIISTLYRDSEQATSGGLTYFLLGGLSSCFILLGSSLLYVNSGTTNLDGIYLISSISQSPTELGSDMSLQGVMSLTWYNSYYIHLSLIILSVGFLFKVAAAPFHFWSPDVYDAIPTIVTTFVAIVAKISIFIFFLELVYYTEKSMFAFSWTNCILISSLFSLIVGSVLGLTQSRIKRLFAYSTISHVGFILLALSVNSIESIQAYIFYIITYTISNLNGFIILIAIGYSFYLYVYKDEKHTDGALALKDVNNSPVQLISQLKGYFYINPYLAISLAITLFSFVGVPPLIGFFAKQMVLSAALDSGYVFMALVAILTSVIGAVYYLNIIKQIFFFKSDYIINPSLDNVELQGSISTKPIVTSDSEKLSFNTDNIVLSSGLSSSISILTLLLLLFIYIPNEWFSIANILSLILFKL
jgi:NADH-ubiquinone oxidoreductase chain 2